VAFSQAHLLPSTTDASEWRILWMTWPWMVKLRLRFVDFHANHEPSAPIFVSAKCAHGFSSTLHHKAAAWCSMALCGNRAKVQRTIIEIERMGDP